MELKQQILTDCKKILSCHLNKGKPDWDLWWRQVQAMDKKYIDNDRIIFEYMQKKIKVIFHTLQELEGLRNE